MSIVYTYGNGLYLNITNRCPCSCVFCVRSRTDSLGDADSLWLSGEPTVGELVAELERRDAGSYREVVFCGYGEPTERLDVIKELSPIIRRRWGCRIRLDTNGMGSLINGRDIVPELADVIDAVSISLNAPDEASYLEVTRCRFGEGCYGALLDFVRECRDSIGDVTVSVVSGYISQAQEYRCMEMASEMGVRFRSR